MITEATIEAAIMDVRFCPDELEDIAAEYGIKADVLRARIEKAYGSVDALAGRAVADAKVAERAEAERKEKVAAGIAKLESMFHVMRDHPLRGTEFIYEGDRYVFILLSASHPTYYARCVRLSDGKITGFNKAAYSKLIAPTARIAA